MAQLAGAVVVVGGGTEGVGRAIVDALLHGGARVVVPAPTEAAAERFYLDADPECVPRLRTAVGDASDPQTIGRIAAVARREFGGIDHVVSAPGPVPEGALHGMAETDLRGVLALGVTGPGLLILGLLRHLTGTAAIKRVVAITGERAAPGALDASALGRVFGDGLIGLLRESSRPGVECYALRVPAGERGDAVGGAVTRLLASGAPTATVDLATLVS